MKGIDKKANPECYEKWMLLKKKKTDLAKKAKLNLQNKMATTLEYNNSHSRKRIRNINENVLNSKNIVSMFESSLTRIVGIMPGELSEDLLIVKTYYFPILEDIMLNGFTWRGKKFKYALASAGQTRTKRAVMINESVWDKHQKTFMCGLTLEKINQLGGCNTNKYGSYLSLLNSSTDIWEGFDISKAIVIEDFKTEVSGLVDFIDEKTYAIERRQMKVPITHTDGSGMFLPNLGKRACIVRAPWIKGLLVPFEFDKFIVEHAASSKIKDIWGKEYDIFKDDIQVIFCKSQFKMHQYYSSWQEYIENFKKYNCEFGFCKEEESHIRNSVINYQELQSLNEMTDEELYAISAQSNQSVQNICTNISTMLSTFGATKENKYKSPYQEALLEYPELLQDNYSKITLKEIKDSMVNSFYSGRIKIKGKYLYIIPDFFAACSFWFCGEKNPEGLLADGEVYSKLYEHENKINLLRSPHLYLEHGIRKQKTSGLTKKWFKSNGIYTSCKDLISKLLAFDCDGDTSLCVIDQTIINCAERHIAKYDVVPLFYNMLNAPAQAVNSKTIFDGLIASYTAPSIGEISNSICKIWNKSNFNKESLEIIKLLCLQNNFSIDFAKTAFFPKAPENIDKKIKESTKGKLPRFFIHLKTKGKQEHQIEKNNGSTVNRLEKIIKNPRIKFPKNQLEEFNFQVLMCNPEIELDENLLKKYHSLNRKYHFKLKHKSPDENNLAYIAKEIKEELSMFQYSEVDVCDMLVKYLYTKNSKGKSSLWFCYGNCILNNIRANLSDGFTNCDECGKRIIAKSDFNTLCTVCEEKHSKVVIISCVDCGTTFAHNKRGVKPSRCPTCACFKEAFRVGQSNKKRKTGKVKVN